MLGPEDVTSALVKDVSAIPPLVQANFGIIPRAIINIFEQISEGVRESTEFSIKCSYIEVYNESVNCLLSHPPAQNLRIREFPTLGMCVIGMAETFVTCPEEVFECLALGTLNRITGATMQNSRSSRSHTLFIITMEQKFFDGSVKAAKLNLVDLAGSEKIAKTGAQGARLKEAQNINLSLTTLGRCIKALSSAKEKHIPFRESKLTMILKESLGGNAKTTLLCTASPRKVHFDESIGTLKFAERAKKIQIKAKVNKTESIEELNAIIVQLKEEVSVLRKQIKEAQTDPAAMCSLDDGAIYVQYSELKARFEHYQESAQMEIEQLRQKFEIMDNESTYSRDEEFREQPFQTVEESEELDDTVMKSAHEVATVRLENEALQREIVSLRAENDSLSDNLRTVRQEAEALEVEKYEWEDKLSAEESKWRTEKMKVEELGSRLEKKTAECDLLQQEKAEQVQKSIEMHEEFARMQAMLAAAQRRVEELETEVINMAQTLQAQTDELSGTKQELSQVQEHTAAQLQASADEIAKLRRNEEILRLSHNQVTEEHHALERKLEAFEARVSGRSQQDLNRSFEYERRAAISRETISKLMQEMSALQQAYEHTRFRHQRDVQITKITCAEKVEQLEKTITQLTQKLNTETANVKRLEDALKVADVEQDCQVFKNKLQKEEIASLQAKLSDARHTMDLLDVEVNRLRKERESTAASRTQTLETKKLQFEAQKALKDFAQELQTRVAKLTSENEFMKKTLELKEHFIATLKGSEAPGEFNLEEAMIAHKRNVRTTQSSRRMSSKLSTFVQRVTQDSIRMRQSEDRLPRRSVNILPSVNIEYVLRNVSALYSAKVEEDTAA